MTTNIITKNLYWTTVELYLIVQILFQKIKKLNLFKSLDVHLNNII